MCYGWIDSLIKRIDDDRYARKFTPRKADSNWSSANVKRYAALKKANRLVAPGLERSPEGRPIVDTPRPTGARLYRERHQKNARAWKFFEGLAPSYRRLYVRWVDEAKRDETKQRRLGQVIEMLKIGRKPGLQ